MPVRSGTADLPLHTGRVPRWLADRMAALAAAIAEVVVLEEGTAGLLSRLSDPAWFQALGAVLGMDWHSSGITTSVMGALKRGLAPRSHELGLWVCGGRGRHSRRTPEELSRVGERTGLDGDALARTSRLVAKVDNAAVQDGFALYLHSFAVDRQGRWTVVQQGMNQETGTARRYHWHSDAVSSFVEAPHTAVVGRPQGVIRNLTDPRARPAREVVVATAVDADPGRVERELVAVWRHIALPRRHQVQPGDVFVRRLRGVMEAAQSAAPEDFSQLLLVPGLGPRTLSALALVAEVVHGAPSRFDDPARFAFAHGGKDGHPFPVALRVYDATIAHMGAVVERAKVDHGAKRDALRRLHQMVRRSESRQRGEPRAPDAVFAALVESEKRASPEWGGRTVRGPVAQPDVAEAPGARRRQLSLGFGEDPTE